MAITSKRKQRKTQKELITELPSEEFAKLSTLQDSYWLARRLGISYDKARALGREGKVPCIRIGKLIRYCPQAINEFLESHTIYPEVEE